MAKIFIDGKEGTTGLRIYERLGARNDIELITLSEEKRKDTAARKEALNSCDIAFLCLPDPAAIEAVSLIENPNVKVIDTSTAHRTNPDWVYGFPEISVESREILKTAKRVAVPGCHASGFIALVYPLIQAGILPKDYPIVSHSVTGYSGGGKKMIASYEDENRDILLSAPRQYALTQSHKHLKEMQKISGLDFEPIFNPIVSNYYSGMVVTVSLYKSLLNGKTAEDIKLVYKKLYQGSVVTVEEDPGEEGFISGCSMSGKDNMELFVLGNQDRIILTTRFDNLGKGASGAAVQCMNIMLGADETTGLVL